MKMFSALFSFTLQKKTTWRKKKQKKRRTSNKMTTTKSRLFYVRNNEWQNEKKKQLRNKCMDMDKLNTQIILFLVKIYLGLIKYELTVVVCIYIIFLYGLFSFGFTSHFHLSHLFFTYFVLFFFLLLLLLLVFFHFISMYVCLTHHVCWHFIHRLIFTNQNLTKTFFIYNVSAVIFVFFFTGCFCFVFFVCCVCVHLCRIFGFCDFHFFFPFILYLVHNLLILNFFLSLLGNNISKQYINTLKIKQSNGCDFTFGFACILFIRICLFWKCNDWFANFKTNKSKKKISYKNDVKLSEFHGHTNYFLNSISNFRI